MTTRPHRPTVNLTDEEAAALQAHPDYTGSLAGTLRLLALRAAGHEPSDPYAAHRARPRDEKGRVLSMLLYDVFYKGPDFDSDVRLPKPADDILYAACKNGERKYLVPRDGEWVEVPEPPARR